MNGFPSILYASSSLNKVWVHYELYATSADENGLKIIFETVKVKIIPYLGFVL